MNNGFASELFEIKRGVRQGDPLFIIALEIVNVAIRKTKEIEGITLGKNEVKLSVFADDLTTFVKNAKSFRLLVTLLVACSRLSVCGERAKKRASAEKTSGDEGERRKESL